MDLRTLSLFTGAGGLDLAIDLAADYLHLGRVRPLCYVEREITACAILAARFADGSLPAAPIWSDVSTFDGGRLRGMVDLIHGGFPCTDLSVAGKQAGITGVASGLWFEYVRIIREVQPGWVFVENVPPVLHLGAGRAVLGELAGLRYDAEWLTLRASDVGAPHQRKRVFILARNVANASGGAPGQGRITEPREALSGRAHAGPSGPSGILGDAGREGLPDTEQSAVLETRRRREGRATGEPSGTLLADAGRERSELLERQIRDESTRGQFDLADATQRGLGELRESFGRNGFTDGGDSLLPIFPPGPGDVAAWRRILCQRPDLAPAIERELRGLADGLSGGLEFDQAERAGRLRSLGNAVCPPCGAVAFIQLFRRVA